MPIREDIRSRAERVLGLVTGKNASGDLIVSEETSLSLKAFAGELEEHEVSSRRIYGVRVIKGAKTGIAYSEASDRDALDSMVAQALTNASFARADPDQRIPDHTGTLATDDAVLCPPDDTTLEVKIDAALTIERKLTARAKVKNVPYNGVRDVAREQHVFSTAGLCAYSQSRVCSAWSYALAEDGDRNVVAGIGRSARRFGELDIDAIVDETHTRCLALLDGEAVPSGRYDVLFDTECQSMLFGVFAMMFSAKAAKDGVNPMRDKVGEMVADGSLSVYDAPRRTEGLRYALFDDEGTATAPTRLIDGGRLATFVHNSATAAYFGLDPTGHGVRSPRSPLGVRVHQFEVETGRETETALASGEYLEIVDLTGLHSGGNPVSGDFSFGAAGFLCRDGERRRAVRNITVAGNFYDLLQRIAGVGDVQHWNAKRSSLMARLRFADVAISG